MGRSETREAKRSSLPPELERLVRAGLLAHSLAGDPERSRRSLWLKLGSVATPRRVVPADEPEIPDIPAATAGA